MSVKNIRHGTMKVRDGKQNYSEIEIAFEEGDLKFDLVKNVIEVKDRGSLADMILGEEEAVKGSFSVYFDKFYSLDNDSMPSLYEALFKRNKAASWASTFPRNSIYTVKFIFEISPSGDEEGERITFNYARVTKSSFEESKEVDKLSFEFTDFEVEPTIEKF